MIKPLRLSDLWWSRDSHPVSGLFPGRVAGCLPRFTATSPARPGLTVGSTLDGGPNWADDANSVLVACEVDRCIVITVMRRPTGVAVPALGPSDVLHMPAGMAGFRRREPAVGNDRLRPVPARLIGQVAPGVPGAASESPRRLARAPDKPFCRTIPAASKRSTTVRPWVLANRVVRTCR